MGDSGLTRQDGHGSANSLRPPDEAIVSVIRTPEELKEALKIRQLVFVEGQGVPLEEEIDKYDGNGDPQKVSQDVVHVLAHMNGKAVGTGRLLINPPFRQLPKAQRIAVLKEAQGKGVGRRLMLVLQIVLKKRSYAARKEWRAAVHILRLTRSRGFSRMSDVSLHFPLAGVHRYSFSSAGKMEQAWARGFRGVELDAQVTAIAFYEKLGYKVQGDIFLDAGLEHKKMQLLFRGAGQDNE